MRNSGKQEYSKSLSALLACLLITYALGAASFVLNLIRTQQPSMDFAETFSFALVFLLGAASTWAIYQHKRMGVYGLILTWTITALLNLVFPNDHSSVARLAGITLIALFVFLIRPAWKSME